MSFLDLTLKTEYRSLREDVAKDFLNPVLKQSILYRRAVGYFSSSGLMALSEGIFSLTEKGGTIQLIISPQLSEEDLFAIKDGIYRRGKVTAEEFINHCGDFDKPRCNFLSNLIATGRLAIKMAFIEESGGLGRFNLLAREFPRLYRRRDESRFLLLTLSALHNKICVTNNEGRRRPAKNLQIVVLQSSRSLKRRKPRQ